MTIKKRRKRLKKYAKGVYQEVETRVKALRVHPYYRAAEDATLGTWKQASDDSKKLSKGTMFETRKPKALKKTKAYRIKSAVWGGNL